MRNVVKMMLLFCMLAVAGAANAQGKGYSDDTVKIGVLTDLSGIFSDLAGRGDIAAAQLAIDDFRKENDPSFDIELVSADHQNKTDVAVTKARKWYDVEGVDMITDVVNSAVALAVSDVTRDEHKALLVTGSGTTKLTDENCSPNTVHYGWDAYALANTLGRSITKRGGKTWFLLKVNYEFGRSLAKNATKGIDAAGGKVIGSVTHPIGATDFSSFLLQAQASGAQVIGFANAGGDFINAVKAAHEFRIDRQQTLAGLGAGIPDIHTLGPEITQGLLLPAGFYWDQDKQTRAWSQRFSEKMGKKPNVLPAATYSAVLTYLKAVDHLGTDDGDTVMKYLRSGKVKVDDMFAPNGYIRKDGILIHDFYLAEVKKPSESSGPWDLYKIKETIPGETAFEPLSSESACSLLKQ